MKTKSKPKLKRDWIGRRVRTLQPLQNGWGIVPSGTVMRVTRNRGGLDLMSDPCNCCRVQMIICKVAEYAVELLDA